MHSREMKRFVKYVSNLDLCKSKYSNWRETLFRVMGPDPLFPRELALVCWLVHSWYWTNQHVFSVRFFFYCCCLCDFIVPLLFYSCFALMHCLKVFIYILWVGIQILNLCSAWFDAIQIYQTREMDGPHPSIVMCFSFEFAEI